MLRVQAEPLGPGNPPPNGAVVLSNIQQFLITVEATELELADLEECLLRVKLKGTW